MSTNPVISELEDADLTVHQQVDAIFAGTQALLKAGTPIGNVISSIGKHRTSLEDALAGTYFRMCLLMESLTRLNNRRDFQVSLHCARCMYELYIDVLDLVRNPALLPKFEAFIFVTRFTAAEKLVTELTNQGIHDPSIHKHERNFISDAGRRTRFDDERRTHWPDRNGNPTTPSNWTGQNLADRARAIGPVESVRYRELYALLCWYSHAGLAGISNLSADALESAMGMAHAHAQDFYFEATNLIAVQFDIYRADASLRIAVDQYKQATATVMLHHLRKLQATID